MKCYQCIFRKTQGSGFLEEQTWIDLRPFPSGRGEPHRWMRLGSCLHLGMVHAVGGARADTSGPLLGQTQASAMRPLTTLVPRSSWLRAGGAGRVLPTDHLPILTASSSSLGVLRGPLQAPTACSSVV